MITWDLPLLSFVLIELAISKALAISILFAWFPIHTNTISSKPTKNTTTSNKRGQRYRAKQHQQGNVVETQSETRSKSKGNLNMLYLGYEYECCAGHRFILSPESSDIMKILNPSNASMSTSAKVT